MAKKRSKKKRPAPSQGKEKRALASSENSLHAAFLKHMGAYTGTTVTVYTGSGGNSGCGMTGVLIGCGGGFIRLLVQAAAPPRRGSRCHTCPLLPLCPAGRAAGRCMPNPAAPGTIAEIPAESIVAFAHSAVRGDNSYNT